MSRLVSPILLVVVILLRSFLLIARTLIAPTRQPLRSVMRISRVQLELFQTRFSLAPAFCALLLLPATGFSQTALTCTPPTQMSNGTAITGTISYRFYRGASPTLFTVSQASTSCSTSFASLPAGTSYFAATAIVGGVESAFSATNSKVVPGVAPNPPTILAPVSLAGPVFSLQTTNDAMVNPQLGTIVAGKSCDYATGVIFGGKVYLRVNVADASLLPGVDKAGLMLVAACQ